MSNELKDAKEKFLTVARSLIFKRSGFLSTEEQVHKHVELVKDEYESIEDLYRYPDLKFSLVMLDWILIKNCIKMGYLSTKEEEVSSSSLIAHNTSIFENYIDRVHDSSSWTQNSIDFCRESQLYFNDYFKHITKHPLAHISSYSTLTLGQLEDMFLLRAYCPSALSDQKHILDNYLGCAYFERRSRGGLIKKLSKTFSNSKVSSAYKAHGMSTIYSLSEHIKSIKDDMSWVNTYPLVSRRALLKGKWSLSDLISEGINPNNLARSLNADGVWRNSKQHMMLQMEILSPIVPGLSGSDLKQTEEILNSILELCPHHMIDRKVLLTQIDRTLQSSFLTDTQKLAAQIGKRVSGKEDFDMDLVRLSEKERAQVLKKVLGPKYKSETSLAIRLMNDLDINTRTKTASKMKRKGIMSDLGM